MFLVPAVAAVLDILVLYLDRNGYKAVHADEDFGGHDYVYNVAYLVPLAVIRLILLVLPLAYHTYTGTAVKYPILYLTLYGGTIIAILIQMLSLIMLDPDSLSSFLPTTESNVQEHVRALLRTQHHITMHIWILLSLSLWSTAAHTLLLWRVRSTAPKEPSYSQKRQNRIVYYYAKEQEAENSRNYELEPSDSFTLEPDSATVFADTPKAGTSSIPQNKGTATLIEQMRCLPDGSFHFVSDLQIRLNTAKRLWAERLEDFTNRIGSHHGDAGGTGSGAAAAPSPFLQLTPFRVLLQLFAYEEVIENHKLDHVFDMDDGTAITFYVPQLLSFLLHGAFHNSPHLEEWILEKCSKNVHFAHRCFWFLRAWCLEGSHTQTENISSNNSTSTKINSQGNGLHHPQNLISDGGGSTPSLGSLILDKQSQVNRTKNASFASLDSSLDLEGKSKKMSKYHPEEHSLIEALLYKVMECGEEPARILQRGSEQFEEDAHVGLSLGAEEEKLGLVNEDTFFSQALENANSPATVTLQVNPSYGLPSIRHLDAISAKKKFGFVSLDSQESWMESAKKRFSSTPDFLDALTTLADDLFFVPRDKRTKELRRRLNLLEVDLLPSNSVYVPIGNPNHRVWRIVADESIAISTKERVPCIICLEVVDYKARKEPRKRGFLETALMGQDPETSTGAEIPLLKHPSSPSSTANALKFLIPGHSNLSEREVLNLWQTAHRDPQRHNSLLDKVTTFTQMRLRKLREHQKNPDVMVWSNGNSDDATLKQLTTGGQKSLEDDIDSELTSLTKAASVMHRDATEDGSTPIVNRINDLKIDHPPKPPMYHVSTPITLQSPSSESLMGQWGSPIQTPPLSLGSGKGKTKTNVSDRKLANESVDEEFFDSLEGFHQIVEKPSDTIATSLHGTNDEAYGATRESSSLYQNAGTIGPEQVLAIKAGRSDLKEPSDSSCNSQRKSSARPPPVVFKESWLSKQERIRSKSAFGAHPGWRLLPIMIKSNDDLRQEQLASQLIYCMASILSREKVPVWLCPYEIVALTDRGGIIEAISDTISIDSLKRNDPNYTDLSNFFLGHFGEPGSDEHSDAKANFVESLAAYSIVCFLLQIKDRHNGNIMLDKRGHVIHIDFGFFFLSSPGKNSGFESAPFKLTRDFVDLMDGPNSKSFRTFRELCCRTFLSLRRNCYQITLLVEMLMVGNEDLACFRGRPEDAVREIRERFRLDLNDRACMEYVNDLIDESLENWRTRWYDRYQRFCVGVL